MVSVAMARVVMPLGDEGGDSDGGGVGMSGGGGGGTESGLGGGDEHVVVTDGPCGCDRAGVLVGWAAVMGLWMMGWLCGGVG
jgi:hypothetical protein